MSSRNLLNLVLLVTVGILVLLVIYEPGKEPVLQKKLLTSLDKNSINKITIKRIGVKDVVLTRDGKDWNMQTPYQLPANEFKAQGLLDLLVLETEAHYDLSKLDLKIYGLDKPRASITFDDKHTFEFGSTEPLNNHRYIRSNNTLYVAADIFYHRMSFTETDYLDHALFPRNKSITKINLPKFSMTLNDGNWQLQPKPESWSNDQANELMDHWQLAQAIQITPYDKKQAKRQVKVFLQSVESPIIFHILKTEQNFYLARPDLGLKYELAIEKFKDLMELPPKIEAELPKEETEGSASSDKTTP